MSVRLVFVDTVLKKKSFPTDMWVGDHKVSFERESWLVLVVSVPLHAGGQTEQTHQRFRGSAQTRKITLRARRYLSRSFWHRIAFDVFPS